MKLGTFGNAVKQDAEIEQNPKNTPQTLKVSSKKRKIMKLKPGTVVMVITEQAGTIWGNDSQIAVLLQNGDIWYGNDRECWEPTSPEELAEAKLDYDRFKK